MDRITIQEQINLTFDKMIQDHIFSSSLKRMLDMKLLHKLDIPDLDRIKSPVNPELGNKIKIKKTSLPKDNE